MSSYSVKSSTLIADSELPSEFRIVDGLRTFSYNPDERCGTVAAAILLAYYDDEVNDAIVDDIYYARVISNATFSEYYNLIFDNIPVIIDLDDHPTYDEHFVVGYGTDMQMYSGSLSSGIISFAIVNDGWGDNEIMINWDYVCDIVYLYER